MSKKMTPLEKHIEHIGCEVSDKKTIIVHKEVTPLEKFMFLCEDGYIKLQNYQEDIIALEYIDDIETALKDYEENKKELKLRIQQNGELVSQIAENDKKLKALEIIKKKGINIQALKVSKNATNYNSIRNINTYNASWFVKKLTKEEYDLLKEVLQ